MFVRVQTTPLAVILWVECQWIRAGLDWIKNWKLWFATNMKILRQKALDFITTQIWGYSIVVCIVSGSSQFLSQCQSSAYVSVVPLLKFNYIKWRETNYTMRRVWFISAQKEKDMASRDWNESYHNYSISLKETHLSLSELLINHL